MSDSVTELNRELKTLLDREWITLMESDEGVDILNRAVELIESGAEFFTQVELVDEVNEGCSTAMSICAGFGFPEQGKKLASIAKERGFLDEISASVLYSASAFNNAGHPLVTFLFELGVSPNKPIVVNDDELIYPFHDSLKFQNYRVALEFLKHPDTRLDLQDGKGRSGLELLSDATDYYIENDVEFEGSVEFIQAYKDIVEALSSSEREETLTNAFMR